MRRIAKVAFVVGVACALVSLVWMLWLPVFGNWEDVPLPMAIGGTSIIVGLIGALYS